MKNSSIYLFLSIIFFCTACGNLEKEIDLELPVYEPSLVVECYLEPGKPFALLLTRSQSFFDPFNFNFEDLTSLLEDSASVVIRHNGIDYELKNELTTNPPLFNKFYNYSLAEPVPLDFENDFELEIVSKNDELVTATTRILPPVPIDSVILEFDPNNDTLARSLTYLEDDLVENNFYRRQLHLGSLALLPEQDFTTSDDFVEDGTIVFGGPFDYALGDTLIHTITHIDKAYYDFLESVQGAVAVNGNPFGQPGAIISNVQGEDHVIGIFTGLSYDRVEVIVEK